MGEAHRSERQRVDEHLPTLMSTVRLLMTANGGTGWSAAASARTPRLHVWATGQRYLLALVHDDTSVLSLQLEPLGRINPPATLSYLDNGVVFVGSSCGDSQLVSACA